MHDHAIWCKATKFGMVTHLWEKQVLGIDEAPIQGDGPNDPNFWIPIYARCDTEPPYFE